MPVETDATLEGQQGETPEAPDVEGNFSYTSLDAVRKKLLDLSGRNPLLNYKHRRASSVRIIDELPNQLFEQLKDGKTFKFVPVAEPTREELIDEGLVELKSYPSAEYWAKHLGFNTSYELPNESDGDDEERHQDLDIQTLMYTPDLESKMRGIKVRADTAIAESGSNVLYLVLGFLEWYETREAVQKRWAPLFTVPVKIDKGELDKELGVFRYTITLKDEGLLSNITLQEKLLHDFELSLPEVTEDTDPESYFQAIGRTVLKQKPRWKLHRMATLALLNFSKQVMYKDLDPENWPDDKPIADHPVVKQFFASQQEQEQDQQLVSFAEEYDIDNRDDIHTRFPLVYDADSSQHSALIDAVDGKNLVIEGPPGSGKSQTITNLIAASIANGKRVLFVAEKMAALEVVKKRLDDAGLGDFCLELHSHKTQRKRLLEDLMRRSGKQYNEPSDIQTEITHFEGHKSELNKYAKEINSEWQQTGLSIHKIFNAATRFREQLKIDPSLIEITLREGQTLTPVLRHRFVDNARLLANIFEQVQAQADNLDIANHHWFGVNNCDLAGMEHQHLTALLVAWNAQLTDLANATQNTVESYELADNALDDFSQIESFVAAATALPDLLGGEPLQLLGAFLQHEASVWSGLLDEYEALYQRQGQLETCFTNEAIVANATSESIVSALTTLENSGVLLFGTIEGIHTHAITAGQLHQQLAGFGEQLRLMGERFPNALNPLCNGSFTGLQELRIFMKLVCALPVEHWQFRAAVFDNPEMDVLLDAVSDKFTSLLPVHENLREVFDLQKLPDSNELNSQKAVLEQGGFLSVFDKAWWRARKHVVGLANTARPNKKQLFSLLPELVDYKKRLEEVDSLFSNAAFAQSLYEGMDTPLQRIQDIRAWYRQIRTEYGRGFAPRAFVADELFGLDQELGLDLADQGFVGSLEAAITGLTQFRGSYPHFLPLQEDQTCLIEENSPVAELANSLGQFLTTVLPCLVTEALDVDTLRQRCSDLAEFQNDAVIWHEHELLNIVGNTILALNIRPGGLDLASLEVARNWSKILAACGQSEALATALVNVSVAGEYETLRSEGQNLDGCLQSAKAAYQQFAELGTVNNAEWTRSAQGGVAGLVARNSRALDNPNWLNTWLDYIKLRRRLTSEGMEQVLAKLEAEEISSDKLCDVVQMVLMNQLAKEILQEPYLANFAGLEQNDIVEQFREYDRQLLTLQRKKVAWAVSRKSPPKGNNTGPVGNYTELALIQHEAGKQKRHIPVRKLIDSAGGAIQALKPCFMMSPMSVAQYLEPGKFEFDLVVMDEASQIRPEDALGAIARGKSLVVVGDPKQLPPTSFFDKMVVDDDDDDTVVALQQSESILDTAIPMFRTRRLRWHYRSRHESLIAFSNRYFYDSNLVIFPSPYPSGAKFGVKFHRVSQGRFNQGRNVKEARELAEAALTQLCEYPDESVGLVAMNAKQREEIETHIEQLVKDNPSFRKAYDANAGLSEPLFIKNLENVQGDERDVIMISMTYGPDEVGGRVFQRFGPINTDVGWRRLNVLFTRSKKRMHIFSSMSSDDILVDGNGRRGVQALRNFLKYCEKGHLHEEIPTGRAPDSDFEIAVMGALSAHGYECEPQLGVAGFRLDVAVRAPGVPGRFLMGVECDGASYHSAKSARG